MTVGTGRKMETKKSEFFKGARDISPLVIGTVPGGIVFGILSRSARIPVLGTMGMSLLVFNGPSQFVAIGRSPLGNRGP